MEHLSLFSPNDGALAIEKSLFCLGTQVKCVHCPFAEEILISDSNHFIVKCWFCKEVLIDQEKILTKNCQHDDMKTVCQNFYVF